ncbi:hypothetical protein G9A89_012298 [Geosiphon pyriformis]|nr:hypothetical protein G9A89_012298 [Geosiphon pyriformis]
MSESFILHEELLKVQEENYFINNEIQIPLLDERQLERLLNDIVERLAISSQAITEPELFDALCSFIKNFNRVKPSVLNRIFDTIISGFQSEVEATSRDLDPDEEETFLDHHRHALEMYAFLLEWVISMAETKATSKSAVSSNTAPAPTRNIGGGRGKRSKPSSSAADTEDWDWSAQQISALDLMLKVLDMRINKIWTSTHERDTFVSVFTKPTYQMLENTANTKLANVKFRLYNILSKCVKDYNHAFGAQTTIIQNLQYYEHLSEPMAEFLQVLEDKYNHTQLCEEILIEISNKDFKAQDITGPKSFSKFLLKLSELVPKLVVKQIGLLIKHLDSESYTMRCGIIEVIGYLITYIANLEEKTEIQINQTDSFFDILEERFLDINAFCRSKVLQVFFKLCDLNTKFPRRRQRLTDLVIRSLEDKSFNVRKNAIKLLTKLIATHPYGIMYGGELSVLEWEERLGKVEEEFKIIQERVEGQQHEILRNTNKLVSDDLDPMDDLDLDDFDPMDDVDPMDDLQSLNEIHESDHDEQIPPNQENKTGDTEQAPIITNDKIKELQLTKRFHADAVRFIHQIHTAIPTLCRLLASTIKAEVMEAIDFFVTAHAYKIEMASEGIKKMVHLIWTKDTNDEGKGIRKRLIESYRILYFTWDESLSEKENVDIVTKNLISLTFNATLAELTSLDLLLSTMMIEPDCSITDNIIEKLWSVYATARNVSKVQRRGAIIILGMLAKAKMEIVSEKIDLLLKIGLGPLGKADLVLARYTCIALQRLAGSKTKVKGTFVVAEQAINTIYLLGKHPDVLCGEIIKRKTALVFDLNGLSKEETEMENEEFISNNQETSMTHPVHLSQLLFIAGHVAIKQIVHLEVIEAEWKRKRSEAYSKDKEKSAAKITGDDELDQVVGTAEDEFGEAVAHIREKELLFAPDSLLPVFGSMVIHICANNKSYKDRTLQIAATLALSKFMCVSSEFCENNLPLLFTILEKTTEPTIRSNIIIALGDMTVCFNNIIDDNINYLYKRLADPDNMVKKNTLMVLTHLILNGMIKVKGQLGEMAKCLEDPEQRISDLARLFFTELASKDNAVYNNLPDIVSNLSSGDNAVNEESFKRIMKFLFDFIEKDKQTENVVEKLCQRFKNLDDERQWRDIAFCLSLLPYKSEKSFKKLVEGMPHYQDKLHEEAVYKYFVEIVSKARSQKLQKPEMKPIIDELESKIAELKSRGEDQEETIKKATAAAKKIKPKEKGITASGSSSSNHSLPAVSEHEKISTTPTTTASKRQKTQGETKKQKSRISRSSSTFTERKTRSSNRILAVAPETTVVTKKRRISPKIRFSKMLLPSFIKNPAVALIGEKCYSQLVEEFDLGDTACIKLLFSKALGIGIVVGGSLVKLPQVLKIIMSGSARGLSFESYALETFAYSVGLAYNIRQGNPFSTYGENFFLTIQNVILLFLILNYRGRSNFLLTGFAIFAITFALGSPSIINDRILAFLQTLTIPISLTSKIPQIIKNYTNGSTGQLSAFAVFGYTLGSLARIFTTITEVDDSIILTGFLLATVFNSVLALQMIYYWNTDDTTIIKKAD